MSRLFVRPTQHAVDAVRHLSERTLSLDEFNAYVDAPASEDEQHGISELITWFTGRYPRPLDRLVYARRAYARAQRLARRE